MFSDPTRAGTAAGAHQTREICQSRLRYGKCSVLERLMQDTLLRTLDETANNVVVPTGQLCRPAIRTVSTAPSVLPQKNPSRCRVTLRTPPPGEPSSRCGKRRKQRAPERLVCGTMPFLRLKRPTSRARSRSRAVSKRVQNTKCSPLPRFAAPKPRSNDVF